jgi:hypothetical protein
VEPSKHACCTPSDARHVTSSSTERAVQIASIRVGRHVSPVSDSLGEGAEAQSSSAHRDPSALRSNGLNLQQGWEGNLGCNSDSKTNKERAHCTVKIVRRYIYKHKYRSDRTGERREEDRIGHARRYSASYVRCLCRNSIRSPADSPPLEG